MNGYGDSDGTMPRGVPGRILAFKCTFCLSKFVLRVRNFLIREVSNY